MISPTSDHPMRALLVRLRQILTGGEQGKPARDQFLLWFSPGIPLAPGALRFAREGLAGKDAAEARELVAQAADLARLVNVIPTPSGVHDTSPDATAPGGGALLWDVYRDALLRSEVASGELAPDVTAKIAKFQNLLRPTKVVKNLVTDEEETRTVEGPLLRAYKEKEAEYVAALCDYNARRIAVLAGDDAAIVRDWAFNATSHRRKVQMAMDAWVTGGYKNEVEAMSAFIAQVGQRDMTLIKRDMLDRLERARLTDIALGGDFYSTGLVPGDLAASEQGWSRFRYDASTASTSDDSETSAWSAELGGGIGPLGARVHASHETEARETEVDSSGLRVSFSMVQGLLTRPWFAPEFLQSGGFRFPPDGGLDVLSDGGDPPRGRLVAYATAAVFLRDLVIDMNDLHKKDSSLRTALDAGGDVSYGPFRLGGGHRNAKQQQRTSARMTDQGLAVEGMQLVALRCVLLPRSPDPSPGVTRWV